MRNMAALSRAMDVIAAKKRIQVLCCIEAGQRRFNEIKRSCGDMSSAELSRALGFLKSRGIVVKVGSQGVKGTRYELTELGRDFSKVLYAMESWGSKI